MEVVNCSALLEVRSHALGSPDGVGRPHDPNSVKSRSGAGPLSRADRADDEVDSSHVQILHVGGVSGKGDRGRIRSGLRETPKARLNGEKGLVTSGATLEKGLRRKD